MYRSMLVASGLFTLAAIAAVIAVAAEVEEQPRLATPLTTPTVTENPTTSEPLDIASIEAMFAEAQEEPPAPEPVQVAPPVLSLPESRPMPFTDVLEPETFADLWTIIDPQHGYTVDGPRYFLAHTHTQGGAIGNAVNDAGLKAGDAIEIAGVRYYVTNVSTIAKPDIATLPIWQATDPDDAYLVVCQFNNGIRATHNLVIEMHRP